LENYFYLYGWAKYGLTNKHAENCRVCYSTDPPDLEDKSMCCFTVNSFVLVPIKSYVNNDITEITILNDDILYEYADKCKKYRTSVLNNRILKQLEKDQIMKRQENEISEIKKKYAKLL